MTEELLIGVQNLKQSLLTLTISALLVLMISYGSYIHYEKKGFISLPLVVFDAFFSIVFLYALFLLLDRKPMLIISEKGIALRKNKFPFAGLKQFKWTEITYFRTKSSVVKGIPSFSLFIGGDTLSKEYSTDLSSLNINSNDILKLVKDYSLKYNIRDLGRLNKTL